MGVFASQNLNDELNKYLSPKDRKKMEEAQRKAQESDDDKKVKIDGCLIS